METCARWEVQGHNEEPKVASIFKGNEGGTHNGDLERKACIIRKLGDDQIMEASGRSVSRR